MLQVVDNQKPTNINLDLRGFIHIVLGVWLGFSIISVKLKSLLLIFKNSEKDIFLTLEIRGFWKKTNIFSTVNFLVVIEVILLVTIIPGFKNIKKVN